MLPSLPASSSNTFHSRSSVSRLAITEPPDPAPMIIKSYSFRYTLVSEIRSEALLNRALVSSNNVWKKVLSLPITAGQVTDKNGRNSYYIHWIRSVCNRAPIVTYTEASLEGASPTPLTARPPDDSDGPGGVRSTKLPSVHTLKDNLITVGGLSL
uniref:Uncharacterized protein n=1 Tax=Anopheles atroparvus TaxID=41427 RepID=A0A182J6W4_ANOAO